MRRPRRRRRPRTPAVAAPRRRHHRPFGERARTAHRHRARKPGAPSRGGSPSRARARRRAPRRVYGPPDAEPQGGRRAGTTRAGRSRRARCGVVDGRGVAARVDGGGCDGVVARSVARHVGTSPGGRRDAGVRDGAARHRRRCSPTGLRDRRPGRARDRRGRERLAPARRGRVLDGGTRPFGRLCSPPAGSRGPGRRSRRRGRLPDPSPGGGARRGAPLRERSNVARARADRGASVGGMASARGTWRTARGARRPGAPVLARASAAVALGVGGARRAASRHGSAMAAGASDRRHACRGDRPRCATCRRSSALGAGPARIRCARRSAAPPRRGRGAPGIGRRRRACWIGCPRNPSTSRSTTISSSSSPHGRSSHRLSGLASGRSSCFANVRRSGSARASLPIRSRRAGARSRSRSVGTANALRCSGNARRR